MGTSLIHIGVGNVGSELVRQVAEHNSDLKYCGMFDRAGGVFSPDGLGAEQISGFPAGADPKVLVNDAIVKTGVPFVLIDTTASDTTTPLIKDALRRGGSVVMSNKKPLTGSQSDWDELHSFDSNRLFYETTVGAALPVIHTLKALLATGDEILKIQGCFSGTLGYLFSELENGTSFSKAVIAAKEQGYTEPDPRDDLSGMDVARKVLILSRVMGKKLEVDDVSVERLYSDALASLSKDDFMAQVSSLDSGYSTKAAEAKASGKVLRYVATVTPSEHSVKLMPVPSDSDIGSLRGPDNIVVIQTKRYFDNPIVIKGPGAGVAVTAAGVFSDVLNASRICNYGDIV